jgi:hypothetical protein
MIDRDRFELIKQKYGHYASWAIWGEEGFRPKDNVDDLTIFESNQIEALLNQLNSNIVLVGLNISRPMQFLLGNFHDGRPGSMDYKIRYALKNTPLWGAYMTDVIKDFEQKAAGKMMAYLRKDKAFERINLELFETELKDLGADKPTLIAFGRDAFQVLDRNLGGSYVIWSVPHYSAYVSKEIYREQITAVIKSSSGEPAAICDGL